jgi:hypothetical protein
MDGREIIIIRRYVGWITVVFTGIHAQQGKFATEVPEFFAKITYRNRFTIFKRVRKFFAEKEDFHTQHQEGVQK